MIAAGEGSTQLPLRTPDHLDAILQRLQERLASVRRDNEARADSSVSTETLKTAENTLEDVRESGASGVGLSLQALSTIAARVVRDTIDETERTNAIPYKPLLFVGDDGDEPETLTSERMLRKEWSLARDFAVQSRVKLDTPSKSRTTAAIATKTVQLSWSWPTRSAIARTRRARCSPSISEPRSPWKITRGTGRPSTAASPGWKPIRRCTTSPTGGSTAS